MQQQQQQPAPQKKSEGFGGGLFDFDSMKKEQQKIQEAKQVVEQQQHPNRVDPNRNLLHTGQNDTLDSLWSPNQQQPQMNIGGGASFGGPSGFGAGNQGFGGQPQQQ